MVDLKKELASNFVSGADLITLTPEGLYCAVGDFYIDPWRPVPMAIITHAHGDHLRSGHSQYLCAAAGQHVVRARVGNIALQTLQYGEPLWHNGVRISLHPAGHVLGSSQVRLEYRGEVWVASGDYKTGADRTCLPFEAVACHVFITESTFGLPVFRWQPQEAIEADINAWWSHHSQQGKCCVLYAYSFGKAQRILAGVDSTIGPIVVHGAMTALNAAYAASGVHLPRTLLASQASRETLAHALVLAPPSAQGSAWTQRFGEYSDAFASGWMQLRGMRRRRGLDKGFVLSDHADWPGLLDAVRSTGASRIIVTHGYVEPLVRFFSEQGLQAESFKTQYGTSDEEANTHAPTPTVEAEMTASP